MCGQEFYTYKDRKDIKNFCSAECKKKHLDATTTKTCKFCGKEFNVWKKQTDRYTYCSIECRTKDKRTEYNCDYCGKSFSVLKDKIEKNKNGVFCSHKCSTDANIRGVYEKCLNCGNDVYRREGNPFKKVFCSNSCRGEYEKNRITKACAYCKKEYTVKLSQSLKTRFCSNSCKNKWQSENNVGENNPRYTSIGMKCEFCGGAIKVPPYKIGKQLHYFCSYDCTRNFYKIIKNRTKKQRDADFNVARNAIKYIKPSLTVPHKIVLQLLNKLHIYLRIEELIEFYRLDIYLPNHNLGIEVNGDYWHCNPMRYKNIPYKKQFERISNDKSKHSYVKNKYGYEILYLWEHDIVKNQELCKHLILEYVLRGGILQNYNSFNYHLEEDVLVLNDNIIVSYQEKNIEDYRELLTFKNIS